MAVNIRSMTESLLWKQNATYNRNYGKSIGVLAPAEAGSWSEDQIMLAIDLENGVFHNNSWAFNDNRENNPFVFTASDGSDSDVKLSVDGSLQAYSLKIGETTISANYDDTDEKIVLEKDGKTLDVTPTESDGVIATESKLNEIKSSLAIDMNKLADFLEIAKFIPGLADRRSEIENVIVSIRS